MTEKRFHPKRRITAATVCLLTLFLLLLLLKNPSVAAEALGHSLLLCARTILPALFPFMVLSELLIAFGFGEVLGKSLARPLSLLLGISREGGAAVFLGFLCGFPVGARMALSLYDKGRISKGECERLLGFSNLPSIAFLVSAVGASLYQNRNFGVLLWLSCMFSSIAVGVVTRKKGVPHTDTPPTFVSPSPAKAFTLAITSATTAILSICAYILFFGTILACLSRVLTAFSLPESINALLYGFFELSSGVEAAASIHVRPLSVLLCALSVGWSGLSIHCQLMTLCDGRGLSLRFYFRARAAQALLCALLTLIFSPFCLT